MPNRALFFFTIERLQSNSLRTLLYVIVAFTRVWITYLCVCVCVWGKYGRKIAS